MTRSSLLPLLLLGALVGCGETKEAMLPPSPAPAPPPPAPPADPEVVAVFDGGQVSVGDVDAHLLTLPVHQRRPAEDTPMGRWLEGHVRRLVIDGLIATPDRKAALHGVPGFEPRVLEGRRTLAAREYIARKRPTFPVTDEEVATHYAEHRAELNLPERRELFNILVPFEPGASEAERAAVRARTEEVRASILDGASFEEMARQHSRSSSASSGGLVGIVTRAHLRPDAADVVFSLQPGVVSEVVTSSAGCQLFLVRQTIPAIVTTLETAKERVRGQIVATRSAAWLADLVAREIAALHAISSDWPEEGYPEGLGQETVLLQVGEDQLLGKDVLAAVAAGKQPRDAYQSLVVDRVLSAALQRDDPGAIAPLEARVRRGIEREALYQRALRETAEATPPAVLEGYFRERAGRFTSDPKLEASVTSWPIVGDPIVAAEAPRRYAAALRAAMEREPVRAAAAKEPGVVHETIPLTDLRQLARRHPELSVTLMADHREGDVIDAYRAGQRILVCEVLSFVPARELGFAEARDEVLRSYEVERRADVEAALFDSLASAQHAAIFPERLETFGTRLVDGLLRDTAPATPGP